MGETEGCSHCSVAPGLGGVVSTEAKLNLQASLSVPGSGLEWRLNLVRFMEGLSDRYLFVTPRRDWLID